MSIPVQLLLVGVILAVQYAISKALLWRAARRILALQLSAVGLEPRRWESNATRRWRLRAWIAKPATGSKAYVRLIVSEAVGVQPDEVGVNVAEPGHVRIDLPSRVSMTRIREAQAVAAESMPIGLLVTIERRA